MDFHEFFGNLFGFPRNRVPSRNQDGEDEHGDAFGFHGFHDEDHDDNDREHGARHGDLYGDPFRDLTRETEDMFRHFERQFSEMFKNFGLADFPPMNVPSIEAPDAEKKSGSPRDEMLKKPDQDGLPGPEKKQTPFQPFFKEWHWNWPYRSPRSSQPPTRDEKIDRDLDGEIASGNLDAILPGSQDSTEEIRPSPPQSRSYFRSVSVTTVRKPDGSVEERRTVRDDKGNVETTVTKIDGDGNPLGPVETPDVPIISPRRGVIQEPLIPDGSKSIFERLFGKS